MNFYPEELFKRKVDLVLERALKLLIRDPIPGDVICA
jgi:predicted nucleotidyltransferase